ncbi:HlyD family secretion protein [Nitrobacter vulgaris]|uniref:Efflux transporter periplasmic adaptor subunit n=1 Tax=Nitrobacter vulgaris TaxID=29421 RepID=A0A1V4HU81_NITVU|nr:HlyD family efflux transporter periplasmic adaptor subunit [Nitrobacter vulgaris]OPH81405.1 efflux transporter periplasmic adaptor subunit [Nitrobacter vulgaris]
MWRKLLVLLALVAVAGGGYAAWIKFRLVELPAGFAKSNGRLEAERIDIATKFPGRVKEVLVAEGDTVKAGQVLAKIDTAELEAQLREADAAARQSEQQLDQAIALLAQRKSELVLTTQEFERSETLGAKGYTPQEKVDQRRAAMMTAQSAVNSATAGIGLAKAAIEAAVARAERIKENLKDYVLTAPRDGRVQYRLALPGEVLGAGGKVLTLLDMKDVYMTIFLPTKDAGQLELGAEARIVPDALPQYVAPATVSFVASDAQFTPKYVETKSEREKLTFRVKVKVPEDILKRYASRVKAGITGVAYVKLVRDAVWPTSLQVKLPPAELQPK